MDFTEITGIYSDGVKGSNDNIRKILNWNVNEGIFPPQLKRRKIIHDRDIERNGCLIISLYYTKDSGPEFSDRSKREQENL